jgi:iron(III) transport system substrate-binding protein
MSNPRVFALLALSLSLVACGQPDVMTYVALDQEHSETLLDTFEKESGLKVGRRFDTEGSKTVGLVTAILEEKERPRCDVFWNNELAHTVRLMQKGVLHPYSSPSGNSIPAQWKDKDGNWHGFAARARILIVNKQLLPDPKEWPRSMWDLIDPKWKGRCGVAKPLTGTTLTHFTALASVLPAAEFTRFVDGLFTNEVVRLESNGATMRQVQEGKLAWAFTDTDDYHVSFKKGHPVAAVFPDQQEGGIGTMLIPNSVCIIKDGPHPEAAKKLVDWLLSEKTEGLLAAAKSAQLPLRPGIKGPDDPSILAVDKFRAMKWDPVKVAESLDKRYDEFKARFTKAQ